MKKLFFIFAIFVFKATLFAQAPELKNMMPNSWEKLTRLSEQEEKDFLNQKQIKSDIEKLKSDRWTPPRYEIKEKRVYKETANKVDFYRVLICNYDMADFLNTEYRDTTVLQDNFEEYAKLTGVFNEDYMDVRRYKDPSPETYRKTRTQYCHFGIDYFATKGTEVISFIHGKVILKGWVSSDGLSLIVQRDSPGNAGDNYLYLLCHLSSIPDRIKTNSIILPGQIVAKTGASGGDGTIDNPYQFDKFDEHLHVSVMKYDSKITKISDILSTSKNTIKVKETNYYAYPTWNYSWIHKTNDEPPYVDPFNYTVSHLPTKYKG